MDLNDNESINFSFNDANLEAFLQNLKFSKKTEIVLDLSVNENDLNNNKHLKKIYSKRYSEV
jgi:hypothetical protein